MRFFVSKKGNFQPSDENFFPLKKGQFIHTTKVIYILSITTLVSHDYSALEPDVVVPRQNEYK